MTSEHLSPSEPIPEGAIDLHLHCGPSPIARRGDGTAMAKEAAAGGFAAVVLKQHFMPTAAATSAIAGRLVDAEIDIDTLGSVVLNYAVGGFNPFAVRMAARYEAAVVWAPTIDARHHADKTGSLGSFLDAEASPEYDGHDGITALTSGGELRSAVRACLDVVADEKLLFAMGHLSMKEMEAILSYCRDIGHDRVLIDHPTYEVTDLDLEDQRRLVEMGATLNFPALAITKEHGWSDGETIAENISAIGPEHCVISSDLGQAGSPSVAEGMQRMLGELQEAGCSPAECRRLLVTNPAELLGVSPGTTG